MKFYFFKKIVILAIFFLTLGSVFSEEIVKNGSFQAHSDGANIILRWLTEKESNVEKFQVERRIGVDGSFLSIGTVDPKGPSLYEFIDYSAFRKATNIYQYRIKIVFSDGRQSQYVGPISVTHSVSGVRKTWGSIKAMFR